jgi:hypothetical protein
VLADEHLQRKLGGVAPVECIVAQPQPVRRLAARRGRTLTARARQELECIERTQHQAGYLPRGKLHRAVARVFLVGGVEHTAPRQRHAVVAGQPDRSVSGLHRLDGKLRQLLGNQRAQLVDRQLAGVRRRLRLALATG